MKLALASDLHLEFGPIELLNTDSADVLILSGDVMVAADITRDSETPRIVKFFSECSSRFENVIYVLGNHEHYSSNILETEAIVRNFLSQFKNIHLLEKQTADINGVSFIGGTLWTDMNKEDSLTTHIIRSMMNDFRIIYRGTYKLSPQDVVTEHKLFLQYIDEVYNNTENDIVVVGHHAPSPLSINSQYVRDFHMNGGYASDLSEFIINHPRIKIWTHGHTHHEYEYIIGDTRIICNPRGYVGYEERANNFNLKLIEL